MPEQPKLVCLNFMSEEWWISNRAILSLEEEIPIKQNLTGVNHGF